MTTRLKRRKAPKMRVQDNGPVRSHQHLAFIRGFECSIAGHRDHVCEGDIEAAHVRSGTDGGLSSKPSDKYAIPLCREAHRQQHQIGEPAFEGVYLIDMRAIADDLAKRSPSLRKLEREMEQG